METTTPNPHVHILWTCIFENENQRTPFKMSSWFSRLSMKSVTFQQVLQLREFTSLHPGLSGRSQLLACRGCSAFTGFRTTLSPTTICPSIQSMKLVFSNRIPIKKKKRANAHTIPICCDPASCNIHSLQPNTRKGTYYMPFSTKSQSFLQMKMERVG